MKMKGLALLLKLPFSEEIINVLRSNSASGDVGRCVDTVTMCSRYRNFIYTSDQVVGVASWSVQAGDKVVVLLGSSVPFILRRSGSSYRLISDCYLSGFMDGEAIQMLRDGVLEAEDFEIT
jgi:hypothetical protein